MEISLSTLEPRHSSLRSDLKGFLNSYRGTEKEKERPFRTRHRPVIHHSLQEGPVHHKNYMDYLATCWGAHYGVVLAPQHIWYTVLTELAQHIKTKAEHYRPLFTTQPGKTELLVAGTIHTVDPTHFLPQLRQCCPLSPDLFLPEFSTVDSGYDVAAATAFCDAVSPYYNYSMYLCGISKVDLRGTREDWERVIAHLDGLAGRLDLAKTYCDTIRPILDKILAAFTSAPDLDFFKDIFSLERCGSGGQVQVEGWYTKFFMAQPRPGYVENFPSQIASVELTQVETQEKYLFSSGLFSSVVEGAYLVPSFGYIVEEVTEAVEWESPPVLPKQNPIVLPADDPKAKALGLPIQELLGTVVVTRRLDDGIYTTGEPEHVGKIPQRKDLKTTRD